MDMTLEGPVGPPPPGVAEQVAAAGEGQQMPQQQMLQQALPQANPDMEPPPILLQPTVELAQGTPVAPAPLTEFRDPGTVAIRRNSSDGDFLSFPFRRWSPCHDLRIQASDGTHVMFPTVMLAAASPFLRDALLTVPIEVDAAPSLITELSMEDLTIFLTFVTEGRLPVEKTPLELQDRFRCFGISLDNLTFATEEFTPNEMNDNDLESALHPVIKLEEDAYPEMTNGEENNANDGTKTSNGRRKRKKKVSYIDDEDGDDFEQLDDFVVNEDEDDDDDDDAVMNMQFDDSDEDFAPPPKRKRGRPPGRPRKNPVKSENIKAELEEELEELLAPPTRRPGRPPGSGTGRRSVKKEEASGVIARLAELKEKGISYWGKYQPGQRPYRGEIVPADLIAPWNVFPDDPNDDGLWKETYNKTRQHNVGKHVCTQCRFKTNSPPVLEQHLLHHKVQDNKDQQLDRNFYHCLILTCLAPCGTLTALEQHAKDAHDGKMYKCLHCDKFLSGNFQRQQHMERMHGVTMSTTKVKGRDGPAQCVQCGKTYARWEGYKRHLDFHAEYHNNTCAYRDCNAKFETYDERLEHINAVHNQIPLRVCGICPEAFATKAEMFAHRHQFHSESKQMSKYQYCDICGKPSVRLPAHKALEHGLDVPGHCGACNEDFPAIHQHRQEKHTKRVREVPCTDCGAMVEESMLLSHVCGGGCYFKEGNVVKKECYSCNLRFATTKEILHHMKEVHQRVMLPNIGTFPCLKCNEQFSTRLALKDHHVTHLTEEEQAHLSCPYCKKVCHSRARRFAHIRSAHTMPFWCKVCSMRFATKAEEEAHKAQATCKKRERKKVACDVCGKMVKKHILAKHVLTMHADNEEKPFHCRHCNRGFADPKTWAEHENTHTNEKPYKCGECGWGFNAKGSLAAHEIKVHNRPRKLDYTPNT